ncbi:hypothetical protein HMPREF0322_03694 [Desulfitobacterium hafniense DP7]|uniref:Uncharacterized protein n=1 Tax=Desulfitobacterium hafniense DP7 TaxID=537010 RepID=G9XRU6_DESHA|nr:hypothetical protein HMPREF0322_03694 [Desulfitobacterium hafniense DP7]
MFYNDVSACLNLTLFFKVFLQGFSLLRKRDEKLVLQDFALHRSLNKLRGQN